MNAGITTQKPYYTWIDKKGVTQITTDRSSIPKSGIKQLKAFKSGKYNPLVNNLITFSESNKYLAVYFLYALIFSFVILVISKELKYKLRVHLKNNSSDKKRRKIENSGISKMSSDQFKKVSLEIIKKKGFEIHATDSALKNIVEYNAIKDEKIYAVSILTSDNPVSGLILNDILREGNKFNYSGYLIVSNNYFSDEVITADKEIKIFLMDRDEIADLIIKYGLIQN